MPPRAANRKKTPAKKLSNSKSKQQGLQSAAAAAADDTAVFADLDMTALGTDLSVSVDELSDPELTANASKEEPEEVSQVQEPPKVQEPEEPKVLEGEEGNILERQDEKAVNAEESEMKKEVEGAAADSMEVEGVERREEVVVSADTDVVEVKANEEVVEEGKNLGGVTEDNSSMNAEEAVENCEDAGEELGEATRLEKEGQGGDDGENNGPQLHVDAGAEENLAEGEASVAEMEKKVPGAEIEEMEVLEGCDGPSGVKEVIAGAGKGEESRHDEKDNGNANEEDDEEVIEEESDEDNEEEDISDYICDPLTEKKKKKDLEIFVGGLDKGTSEEDLINVFGKFGEIKDTRVVMHPTKKKSKAFAFIRYATLEQAKNVLSELKDGIEVRGKHVKISASQDNDTLYMGNISKMWTKEQVLETLKGYGVEQIEDMHLPKDPKNEGKIKGFALLEFTTHSDAVAAFKRLRMPDAIFGRDRSAKVAFAQTPMHPSEEALSKVKTVYIEGLSEAWDDEKVKEICKQYGEVEKVKLSRNLGTKRKDFGFVTFTSRESAIACVEGVNVAQIGDGEVKVKANIAKPHFRGRLQKQGTRGGFKVKKASDKIVEAGTSNSKNKGRAKSKGAEKKEKQVAAEKEITEEKGRALPTSKSTDGGKPNKPRNVSKGQDVGAQSKPENRKRKSVPLKVDGKKRDRHHGYNRRPEKKRRGTMPSRQTDAFRHPRSNQPFKRGPIHVASSISFRNQLAPGYAEPMSSYPTHSYSTVSGSKRHRSDMEPHAGYLEPAVGQQGPTYAGYNKPALGMQIQSRPGYLEPAVGAQSHHQYNYGMRSTGGYDGLGSNGSAYGAGSARLPSYVANPTTYVYEGSSSTGSYHPGSVPYPRGRAYY